MYTFELNKVFDFLKSIEENNNREWFNDNKNLYLDAKKIFEELVDFVGHEIEKFDPDFKFTSTKDYTFRFNRDTRFSKDKQPYKTNFGAYFSPGGRKSPMAGYYIHLQRGMSFFGGGVYHPENDKLKAIRKEIYYSAHQLDSILNDKSFKEIFPALMDDKLKNGPRDFPKDSPALEYLKYKSFAVTHQITDKEVFKYDFVENVLKGFTILMSLNKYLNNAIKIDE